MTCSLGDDRVPSYEDTCDFTCNTGCELTGSDTRTCQSDGKWSGNETMCNQNKGMCHTVLSCYHTVIHIVLYCIVEPS